MKNEQDVLEPWIRHNAALLDAMVIVDDGSVDDTRAIAMALARELGTIVVTEAGGLAGTPNARLTTLLQSVQSSFFADYLLFLDADEFIGAQDRTSFHRALAGIPTGQAGLIPWRTYVLTEADLPRAIADPPYGLCHRAAQDGAAGGKVVLRLDGTLQPEIAIEDCGHAVTGPDGVASPLAGLWLWRFPVRSHAQITGKSVAGWMSCVATGKRTAGARTTQQWRRVFDLVSSGRALDDAALCSISATHAGSGPGSLRLVRDNPGLAMARRHSTGLPLDPVSLIARTWERSLRPPVELSTYSASDIPPFRFLLDKHRPGAALDVGCGDGSTLELFRHLGVADLAGIGLLPLEALRLTAGGYVRHDPGLPFTVRRSFGLVVSLGAEGAGPDLLDNLVRHAETLIVFAGPPGLKLAPTIAAFRRLGWIPDAMDTLGARCLATTARFRRGLLVLRPLGTPGVIDGSAGLRAIDARPFEWRARLPVAAEGAVSWEGYVARPGARGLPGAEGGNRGWLSDLGMAPG